MFLLPSKDSYRFSEKIINRVRWQQGKNEIKYRTIANIIEKESCKIIAQIENKSLDILKKNGFDKDGIIKDKEYIQDNDNEKTNFLPEDQVINAIESYNEGKTKEMQIEITELHESYENKEFATNISADDVFAKKQKESGRSKYSEHKRKGTRQFYNACGCQDNFFKFIELKKLTFIDIFIIILDLEFPI